MPILAAIHIVLGIVLINNTENRDQYADYITLLQDVLMDGINDMRKR